MKRNKDMCSMTLAKILHFSGQFLDGRLESIIVEGGRFAVPWTRFWGHLGPI